MAHPKRRLPGNAAGDFYVDETCIDCETCRWLAPETFFPVAGQSAVLRQPGSPEARRQALLAAVACPTASIGTLAAAPEMAEARAAFPVPIAEEVYYCGYHSPKSFGAASYLIVRPEGNVLVDSPRRSETLAARIESMGGARWLFLTHGDDVADHGFWRERLGCERILHVGDAGGSTLDCERILSGGDTVELAPDLRIIPVPGHTEGSCALLYRESFLFTGDHLAWSERRGHLYAFRDACWHSWRRQTESMGKLAGYGFEWVLPGHGRRFHSDRETMRAQMEECLEWMRGRG
ncbi:MAG: beta-lactamase domain protein [Fibrobacteres bacterium]|nr:beta-lactamase domain protein [Fibrobacterota bacterium]